MSVFYIGGYQGANTHCLHCCEFSGSGARVLSSYEVPNASYLCFSPGKKHLYAVIESDTFEGEKGGGVAAFAVENDDALRFINHVPTGGEHPCHLSVSGDGRRLYVANYTGGSCAFYNVLPNGAIGERIALVDDNRFGAPSMAVPNRQAGPHAHFIQPLDFGGMETLWLCDLGLDKLLVLDGLGNEIAGLNMPAGFGARHVAFHPSAPKAYVVGELGKAVVAVDYGLGAGGKLMLNGAQPVSVLQDAAENISCAAIRVSPDGRHLLVSNRGGGADSISVLALDEKGDVAGLLDVYKTSGRCPRDFAFTPKGDGVLVAYQDSDFVELLHWHDGKLIAAGVEMPVQKPTCVLF
ncbi:MAG: lactonase family protein [Defluviitaleaceae bacterium]|nr:lactonase family protein [Defluviitaleaceae bacterium]